VIPLVHDFEGERVLVVGGGPVGARKARRFAREAETVVVSPAFADADFGDARLVRATVDAEAASEWLDRVDPALVVAATDDSDLNAALGRAARERGILCNRADESGEREAGSVVVPATVRDDPVVVAVSTGGQSPIVSQHLRDRIEDVVANAGAMAALTGDLREQLDCPAERRREALRAVVESERVWKALDTHSANPQESARTVIADATGEQLGEPS
jgi:precorrin-2 dehydrogenase/sirohydrochlorin ferrochelatase